MFLEAARQWFLDNLKVFMEHVIKRELAIFLDYESYERGQKKGNYRNGFYSRDLVTQFGTIEDVQVARDRRGEFQTCLFERYKRRERKMDQDVLALFINGISTRRMRRILYRLLKREYSAGTVSNIAKELTKEMKAWLQAPIEDDIRYLFIDGINLPVRRFRVSKESLLVAIGITTGGSGRYWVFSWGAVRVLNPGGYSLTI